MSNCIVYKNKVTIIFSIKTCKPDKTTVGHLPREISLPTKFLLDLGAEIVAEIESSH